MLRYYAYYSVGGYKDFILGDSQSKDEARYYLPLLPLLEERAENDLETRKQVDVLKSLPKIFQLSSEQTYHLPVSARVLFSHAGYKLIYRHLEGESYALALRDIPNRTKDGIGRSIPFSFLITGDTADDVKCLGQLAVYFATHPRSVEEMFSMYLAMDIASNGLKFELKKFNLWVNEITTSCYHPLPTLQGAIKLQAKPGSAPLLIVPQGIPEEKVISEQKLEGMETVIVKETDILSSENPERLVKQILELSEALKEERRMNSYLKKAVIAAGVGGFLAGSLITGCGSK